MKYVVIDELKNGYCGDMFTNEFNTMKDAMKNADWEWKRLTTEEKKKTTIYVLKSINPDEDADDHLDGNVIWRDGKRN